MTTRIVPPLWRAVGRDELIWAHWGCDLALFHKRSGLTHFVNKAMATLLCEVLVTPKTVGEAAQDLARAEGAEAGPGFQDEVELLIHRLDTLGLVESLPA